MIVLVKWSEHDRHYTIGISKFLKQLGVEINEEQIKLAVKKLLEQEEMKSGES